MWSNELLLVLTAALSTGAVLTAWKLNRERIYSVILIFLILITIGGAKIIELFGHVTNTGNVFYAAAFLSTYFLIERYGKREGVRSIWVGVLGVGIFSVLLQIVISYVGSADTATLNDQLAAALAPAPRLAFASLAAYALSQTLNVYLYIYLKKRFNGKRLWLRANICNVLAQILDSCIFFGVAFGGVVAPAHIGDILLTGLIIKVTYMAIASPLLYLNTIEQDDDGHYATITLQ